MRIWSIHPKYLDAKGLVALWRETLLAKNVLEGKTKGYTNHPQLNRFKKLELPLDGIHHYLMEVHQEATRRNYNFNPDKFNSNFKLTTIDVTSGQVEYERIHLLNKLKVRDIQKYERFKNIISFDIHPMFNIIEGDIEEWEIIHP